MKRVYVAGPYTNGDKLENTMKAMNAAQLLMDAGCYPYVPHMSHFLEAEKSRDYEFWLAMDFAFLEVCDALVRLSGHSPGADREVQFANERHIPVFEGVDVFLWAMSCREEFDV